MLEILEKLARAEKSGGWVVLTWSNGPGDGGAWSLIVRRPGLVAPGKIFMNIGYRELRKMHHIPGA